MELPSCTDLMDLDPLSSSSLGNSLQLAIPTELISITEEVCKARTALEKKYLKYILKNEKVFKNAGCCTALVPYIASKPLLVNSEPVPEEEKTHEEMMEIDCDCPVSPVPTVNLKRKRCDDWAYSTPKMMKLQCC